MGRPGIDPRPLHPQTRVTRLRRPPTESVMTPINPAGQDASVAVLQSQQLSLESSVRDLARTMSEGFASMSAKMDRLNDISLTIAAMSERQVAHSDGLQRAFNELGKLSESVERMTGEHKAYIDDHTKAHAGIDSRLAMAKGMMIGAGVAYSALLGLLAWFATMYISQTTTNTEHIHELQLLNERYHRESMP